MDVLAYNTVAKEGSSPSLWCPECALGLSHVLALWLTFGLSSPEMAGPKALTLNHIFRLLSVVLILRKTLPPVRTLQGLDITSQWLRAKARPAVEMTSSLPSGSRVGVAVGGL